MTETDKCMKFREQISAMLDDMLQENEKKVLEQHLSECASCRKHLEMMRFILNSTKNAEIEPPEKLHDFIMEKVEFHRKHRFADNKIIRFLSGKPFTIIAAAMAALVLLSPTVINQLDRFSSADAAAGFVSSETELYSVQTTAGASVCSANETNILYSNDMSSVQSFKREIGTKETVSETISDTAAPTSSVQQTAQADGTYSYSTNAEHVFYNKLDALPSYISFSDYTFKTVFLLDSETIPADLSSSVPEFMQSELYSYALLLPEDAEKIYFLIEQQTHIPVYILDDATLYSILNPKSENTLLLFTKLH